MDPMKLKYAGAKALVAKRADTESRRPGREATKGCCTRTSTE
jgi:hypothetical protein